MLKLALARLAARSIYQEYDLHRKRASARERAAREARATHSKLVYELQKLMRKATREPLRRLRALERDLYHVQSKIARALAEPGVPAVIVRRYLEATAQKSAAQTAQPPQTTAVQPSGSPPQTSETPAEPPQAAVPVPSSWEDFLHLVTPLPGGILIGLCLGEKLLYLTKHRMLKFESFTNYWMAFFAAVGAGAIYLFGKGVARTWQIAAEAALAEPPSGARFLNWRTVRHTLFPLGVTTLICAVEASIVRNALARYVPDPQNIAYVLGALPVILPAAIASASLGWKQGCKAARETAEKAEERDRPSAAEARRDAKADAEIMANSPEAQPVAGLAYLADRLQEKILAVQEEIAALLAPYQHLLDRYREDLDTVGPDPDFQALLAQAYEDAVACFEEFLREHQRLVRHLEASIDPRETIHYYWIKSDPAPPTRPSLWQRFQALVGRVLRRPETGAMKPGQETNETRRR
jgi:hypothetical protein